MGTNRRERVQDVFWAACELTQDAREQYLARECAGDEALRKEVTSLLAEHDARGLLDSTAVRPATGRTDAEEPQALVAPALPGRVGSYRILGLLGEGGMGVVYRAEQTNPKRVVAVKVIRPELATPVMLRRFEFEALLLGRLQHPGIAQIFEAGAEDVDGRTQFFFAMELVEGSDLVAYARSQNLDLRGQLALLEKVCDAVQHAHQKGIIHRDLKPANILVTADGHPKILDFGVARSTNADVRMATTVRTSGGIAGTLHYMSPEQVEGDDLEIDTRSDVYALGVVAYELLGGRLPFDFAGKRLTEILRMIAAGAPLRLGSLRPELAGDVEAIIHKALEKDKALRYGSAAELAQDIRRYLRREPVVARPPTYLYRIRRFAQRNRALVAGVAATVLVLLLGVIATTLEARRANTARDLAQATLARQEKIIGFMKERVLSRADVSRGESRDIKLLEVLDRIVREKAEIFPDEPEVRAEVLATVASSYKSLLRFDEARQLFEEALAIQNARLDKSNLKRLETMSDLATLLGDQGRFEEAKSLLTEAIKTYREAWGNEHTETLSACDKLARVLEDSGSQDEARKLYEETLAVERRVLGEDHGLTLATKSNLAHLYTNVATEKAEGFFREVLAGFERTLGPDHYDTLISMSDLSTHLHNLGKLDEAEQLRRRCHQAMVRVLGEKHDETLNSQLYLARILRERGKPAEAVEELRTTLRLMREVHPEDNRGTAGILGHLGSALEEAGKLEEAEPILRESFTMLVRVVGEHHSHVVYAMYALAKLELARKRFSEARALFADLLERAGKTFPPRNWRLAHIKLDYGRCLSEIKDFPHAEEVLESAFEVLSDVLGANHPDTRLALDYLKELYKQWGRPEGLERVEKRRAAAPKPDRPRAEESASGTN